MLGYEPGSKAYRLYHPRTKKIIVSRDVVFEETKQWDWSNVKESEEEPTTEIFTIVDHDIANGKTIIESLGQDEQTEPPSPESLAQHDDEEKTKTPQTPIALAATGSRVVTLEESSPESVGPQGYKSIRDLLETAPPYELEYVDSCLLGVEEPTSVVEAKGDACWQHAMEEELVSI